MKNIKDRPWYSLTIAMCIAVILLVSLVNINHILSAIGTFLGFFSTVFLGAIIAYIINPLANLYRDKIFKKIKKESTRQAWGNALAFLSVIVFLVFLGFMVIPQLIDSVKTFAYNFEGYVNSLERTLKALGVSSSVIDISSFVNSSTDILDKVKTYATTNMSSIMSTTANLGAGIGHIFVAFLLSIYFLGEKYKLNKGGKRFLKALCKDQYSKVAYVIHQSNIILNRYIVYNLIDAMIIGIVNAVFMSIVGLPYVGLVSVLVAVFNIIPTFGPIIGAAIGGLLLLLVEPWYAGAFLAFTAILQTLDGYVIKPKLFGDSLGVSGLWILIGIVAGGKMFGIVGILLAIPMVAILDMLYHKFLLPFLENNSLEQFNNDDSDDEKTNTNN